MWKDRMRSLRDVVIKHSKIAFPLIVIVAVAVTVVVALKVSNADAKAVEIPQTEASEEMQTGAPEQVLGRVVPDVPLERNNDTNLYSLIATYYNALATGDVETIKTIDNYVEDTEEIRIQELSKYIESYPTIEIYTKPGPEENSYIAYVYSKVTFYGYEEEVPGMQTFYVCTDDEGKLYLNDGEVAEDILDYIKEINFQDDVVDLNNRVTVEYNQFCLDNSKMFEYITEIETQVSKVTGEVLAAQVAQADNGNNAADPSAGTDQPAQPSGEEGQTPEQTPVEEPVAPAGPVMATATTTVNVRSSDSENAEKLGKVAGGTEVQVTEQRVNGWSKIVFEGKDGYIKSEYLQVTGEAAATTGGGESIGNVTATENVNIRASASETAEKIGVVVGGESVELLSRDNGWCQIRKDGLVGYVKADYVQ